MKVAISENVCRIPEVGEVFYDDAFFLRLDDASGRALHEGRWGYKIKDKNKIFVLNLSDAIVYYAVKDKPRRIMKPINDGAIFEPK